MWYRQHEHGVLLQVKVTAHAKQNRIIGVAGDFLKVAITAAPEKGKANDALVHFLATEFGLPPSTIAVAKGGSQPAKVLFVPMSVSHLADALKPYTITI